MQQRVGVQIVLRHKKTHWGFDHFEASVWLVNCATPYGPACDGKEMLALVQLCQDCSLDPFATGFKQQIGAWHSCFNF